MQWKKHDNNVDDITCTLVYFNDVKSEVEKTIESLPSIQTIPPPPGSQSVSLPSSQNVFTPNSRLSNSNTN